jgi:AraC-like DNA-binding protein
VAVCEQQLKEIKGDEMEDPVSSTEETVSTLILENPGKIWTLNEVAARLSMSPRTLIRKLESEGTQFQRVRDEMAKKQVANYLADANLSVESVGHLMGFSDVSSFRRSFKRWFGETPSQYIARIRGTPR